LTLGFGRGELTPDGEDGLEDKVERDPVEDSSDTHRLDKVKTAKDDLVVSLRFAEGLLAYPVGEPLLVVVGSWALESVDREISGQSPTNQVGYGLSEAKHVEEDQDDRAGNQLKSRDPH
jgi:hypothetical protein